MMRGEDELAGIKLEDEKCKGVCVCRKLFDEKVTKSGFGQKRALYDTRLPSTSFRTFRSSGKKRQKPHPGGYRRWSSVAAGCIE
jgi:hypothetical protein